VEGFKEWFTFYKIDLLYALNVAWLKLETIEWINTQILKWGYAEKIEI